MTKDQLTTLGNMPQEEMYRLALHGAACEAEGITVERYHGLVKGVGAAMDFLWNGGKPSEMKDVKAYRILMETYQNYAMRYAEQEQSK